MASLDRGAQPWFETPLEQRRALLERAGQLLLATPDPEGLIRDCLGLEAREQGALLVGLGPALDGAALGEGPARPGIAGLRRSWTERLGGLVRAVFEQLAAGQVVLLLSDGSVPALADRLTDALLEAGLPRDALALVHDDGDAALRAAAGDPRVSRLRVSGHPGQQARCAPLLERAARGATFGSGVLEDNRGRDFAFDVLGRGQRIVDLSQDPREAAVRIVEAAFGRVQTLSGQAAGQVGSVELAPRRISVFTEALLGALERDGVVDPALEPLETDLAPALERVRELGLNEGATLIHEARVPSRRPGGGARIARLVFTNVEPGMRLSAWSRPSPVLLISRLEPEPR
jgi:Aldehyde dehydrogenase family